MDAFDAIRLHSLRPAPTSTVARMQAEGRNPGNRSNPDSPGFRFAASGLRHLRATKSGGGGRAASRQTEQPQQSRHHQPQGGRQRDRCRDTRKRFTCGMVANAQPYGGQYTHCHIVPEVAPQARNGRGMSILSPLCPRGTGPTLIPRISLRCIRATTLTGYGVRRARPCGGAPDREGPAIRTPSAREQPAAGPALGRPERAQTGASVGWSPSPWPPATSRG